MNKVTSLGSFALVLSTAVVAQKPTVVDASMPKDMSMPVAGTRAVARMSRTAPEGIDAPAGCVDAWFGTAEVGADKTKVALMLAKTKDDAVSFDTVYVDGNADGKFGDGEKVTFAATKETMKGRNGDVEVERLKDPVTVPLHIGSSNLQGAFSYQRAGDAAPQAAIQYASILASKVKIGAEDRYIVLVDKNANGKHGEPDDAWLLYQNGEKPATDYTLLGWQDTGFANGKRVAIKVEAGNKIQYTTTDAKEADPAVAAHQRERVEKTWEDRFAPGRDEFNKQKEIDTSRPLATTKIHWNYVSFEEAKKLAAAAKKPLFVDVMAFWCVWCYRMDYHTYPDKAVADLLNEKFVPVKIIQEQAVPGDYDMLMKEKLKAQGIPAMGVFDAQGNLLHSIGGWMKPENFLAELEKGLAAVK